MTQKYDEYKEFLYNQLHEEIANFKMDLLRNPLKLFENGEKIHFFSEFNNLLQDKDCFYEYIEKIPPHFIDNVIEESYNFYINSYENPVVICYEEIIDIMKNFILSRKNESTKEE